LPAFNLNLVVAAWINVPSLICMVLMLITFAVLPEKQSHKHYLSVGLCGGLAIFSVSAPTLLMEYLQLTSILFQMAFVIALGSNPDICYNDITPKDMYSSTACGFSGGFFIAGTLFASAWGG
jgi:hypothetical protein